MLQTGDDLVIQIFFWTSGVLCGVEAMKASGWRLWTFAATGAALILAGLCWSLLKDVSPPVTRWVTEVATSPQSWFVLVVLGLLLLAVTGRNSSSKYRTADKANSGIAQVTDGDLELESRVGGLQAAMQIIQQTLATLKSEIVKLKNPTDQIRSLNRTAFLVATVLIDRFYVQELERALENLPRNPDDMPIDTDEKINRETGRVNEYISDVAANLAGSRWAAGFHSAVQRAEVQADSDLLRMDTPAGLHPQRFRLFHIAYMCRDRIQGFLERAITEAKFEEKNLLQMLRERPDIHK